MEKTANRKAAGGLASGGAKKPNARRSSGSELTTKFKEPKPCYSLKKMAPEYLEPVDEELTQGATFEEVAQAFTERNKAENMFIQPWVVANYFRSKPELQQARVRWMQETSQRLKEALNHPDSDEKSLAEAALMLGWLGLNRKSQDSTMQQALRYKAQKENLRIKEGNFELQLQKFKEQQRITEERLKAEIQKRQVTAHRLAQLLRAAERAESALTSDEMLERVREIYGLAAERSPQHEGDTDAAGA